ncbi:hypothetical protein [Agrilutibacter solisilvae]|uniref:Uncharacterized protein n=1 Tax=Agrilutibacter solisilvae TaxID=2763317 RepID=A0A974XX80_9GAMM|nr:hypothetical protein [Lysobacter solisilvae]QSX77496.1 hypothetical protein I8J32_012115 [Lysobacter solisilvae]
MNTCTLRPFSASARDPRRASLSTLAILVLSFVTHSEQYYEAGNGVAKVERAIKRALEAKSKAEEVTDVAQVLDSIRETFI